MSMPLPSSSSLVKNALNIGLKSPVIDVAPIDLSPEPFCDSMRENLVDEDMDEAIPLISQISR